MQDSIFTKIIKGEIPCHKIYEDDRTFVFLDIHPISPGHMLVVPKTQVEFVWDLDDADYVALMDTSRNLARHARDVLGVSYVGEQIIGVDVPHAHVHIIPFETMDQYRNRPDMTANPDHAALSALLDLFIIAV